MMTEREWKEEEEEYHTKRGADYSYKQSTVLVRSEDIGDKK